MLLSKKYKFIFIKSKKVAGTSVEVILSNQLDKEDIVTPVSTENFFNTLRRIEKDHEEDWRDKNKPARNYKGNFLEENFLWFKQLQNYLRRLILNKYNQFFNPAKYLKIVPLKRGHKFYDHMTLEEVRNILGINNFRKYKIVGIIRNPIDQAISDYFDSNNRIETGRQFKNFQEYIDLRMDLFFEKVRKKFEINNKPSIDYFIKFENLKDDLKIFGEDIGFDIRLDELDNIKIHGKYRLNKQNKKINLIISESEKEKIFESAGWLSDYYKSN